MHFPFRKLASGLLFLALCSACSSEPVVDRNVATQTLIRPQPVFDNCSPDRMAKDEPECLSTGHCEWVSRDVIVRQALTEVRNRFLMCRPVLSENLSRTFTHAVDATCGSGAQESASEDACIQNPSCEWVTGTAGQGRCQSVRR